MEAGKRNINMTQDTIETPAKADIKRKFVLEISDARALQMFQRLLAAFDKEMSCKELTPKAGRMDWQTTLERLHGFISDYNSNLVLDYNINKSLVEKPIRATHYATAKRIFDLMIDLYRTTPKEMDEATITVGNRKEHFLCFSTNGAGLAAQLGHEDPRTVDNHLQRLEAAALVLRRDDKAGKIRKGGESSTVIYVNKAVIAYYPD